MSNEKNQEKKSTLKKDSTQPSRITPTRREPFRKTVNDKDLKETINKATTAIEKIINPLVLKLFKKFKCHQTNKYLAHPGPELQLLYLCSNPHIGKVPFSEVVESLKDLITSHDPLKDENTKIDIQAIIFKDYVQVFITLIIADRY